VEREERGTEFEKKFSARSWPTAFKNTILYKVRSPKETFFERPRIRSRLQLPLPYHRVEGVTDAIAVVLVHDMRINVDESFKVVQVAVCDRIRRSIGAAEEEHGRIIHLAALE
jgi:hypothetical protein